MKTHDCSSLFLALLLACWVSPTSASTNYASATDLRDNASPTGSASASHAQSNTTDGERYGPNWPSKIDEFMYNWKKELVQSFGKDLVYPVVKTVPGTSPKGPVVNSKKL